MVSTGSYKRKVNEIFYDDLNGLTSVLPAKAEPSSLVECKNFVFTKESVLTSRPGLDFLAFKPNGNYNTTSAIEMKNPSNDSLLAFDVNQKLMYYSTAIVDNYADVALTSGGSETVFSTTNYKGMCIYNSYLYVVEGVSTILKWDGSSAVTSITLPDTATYGNPVDICVHRGRLFCITDMSYLRYSAVDSDTVWEERVLMGGTISTTATSTAITGTNTIFNAAIVTGSDMKPQAGTKIYITSSAGSEYLTISSVSSATAMIASTPCVYSHTNATWYLVGIDYYEPLSPDDGMSCKQIKPFGDAIGVSKLSDNSFSKKSSIIHLRVQAQTDTGILAISQKHISESMVIHPYSLCEYDDMLLFFTDRGLYALPTSAEGASDVVQPIALSQDKLERKTEDFKTSCKHKTRVTNIRNKTYNLILIQGCLDSVGTDPAILIAGFASKKNGIKFTELSYTPQDTLTNAEKTWKMAVVFNGYLAIITRNFIMKTFEEDTRKEYDDVQRALYTCDTTRITCDSTVYTCDEVWQDTNSRSIVKLIKTGLTSMNLADFLNFHKFYLVTSEKADSASETYYVEPYTVGIARASSSVSSEKELMSLAKTYEYLSSSAGWDFSSTILPTFDATTGYYFSDTSTTSDPIVKQNTFWLNARGIYNLGLTISDETGKAFFEIYGYGCTVKQGKFV